MNKKISDDGDLLEIRKTIIVAIASDESLMERLILKGGNALDIVHKITQRASVDIDFSMSGDFRDQDDQDDFSNRLWRALRDRFDSSGYVVFDEKLEARPRTSGTSTVTVWGGYHAVFKLIRKVHFQNFGGQLGKAPPAALIERMRREAQIAGPAFLRKFEIDISKFEYTTGRVSATVGDYSCLVYTPAMIAAEKLRAICQQLPQYAHRPKPSPRPRDFFDIQVISVRASCDLSQSAHHELVRQMFNAKEVPISLIDKIGTTESYEFHKQTWSSVVDAVRGGPREEFKFYFDFVVKEGKRLLDAIGHSRS